MSGISVVSDPGDGLSEGPDVESAETRSYLAISQLTDTSSALEARLKDEVYLLGQNYLALVCGYHNIESCENVKPFNHDIAVEQKTIMPSTIHGVTGQRRY